MDPSTHKALLFGSLDRVPAIDISSHVAVAGSTGKMCQVHRARKAGAVPGASICGDAANELVWAPGVIRDTDDVRSAYGLAGGRRWQQTRRSQPTVQNSPADGIFLRDATTNTINGKSARAHAAIGPRKPAAADGVAVGVVAMRAPGIEDPVAKSGMHGCRSGDGSRDERREAVIR